MDMRCFVSILTTMVTTLFSTVMSASESNGFHHDHTLETSSMDYSFRKNTMPSAVTAYHTHPHHRHHHSEQNNNNKDMLDDVPCCDGVLGYASDNVSLNYPCQLRPCCNKSHTQAVIPIEYALGFRFQCMPRAFIQTMCYASGTEVRSSNHDPDFIPRACCPGLRFHVELHHWYAALVIRCIRMDDEHS